MKKITIFYWIFTGLMIILMLFSGISGLMYPVQSKALISTHLGYPEYFTFLVSIVKLLGVIVILVPRFPRLKEWVYAGFVFDLSMAIYSFIAVGDSIASTWFMFFGLFLIFGSYIFYHKRLKLVSANDTANTMETSAEKSMI